MPRNCDRGGEAAGIVEEQDRDAVGIEGPADAAGDLGEQRVEVKAVPDGDRGAAQQREGIVGLARLR